PPVLDAARRLRPGGRPPPLFRRSAAVRTPSPAVIKKSAMPFGIADRWSAANGAGRFGEAGAESDPATACLGNPAGMPRRVSDIGRFPRPMSRHIPVPESPTDRSADAAEEVAVDLLEEAATVHL